MIFVFLYALIMSQMANFNPGLLTDCSLFRGVSSDRIPGILEESNATQERHDAGKLVRQQGDTYSSLILLAEGRLEARFDSVSGKGMVVEHFDAPSAVATAFLMSSDPLLPVSLIAESDVALVTVSYEEILHLFVREPEVLKAYLTDAGDKVRFLAEKIRLLRFGSLRMKITAHLLTLAREQGTTSPRWRYGREQMADLLGVARPSLSRELSRMVDEGILEMPDRNRLNLKIEALENITDE